jgi:hypothetical protein
MKPVRANVKSFDDCRRNWQTIQTNLDEVFAAILDVDFDDVTVDSLTIDALSGILKATAGLFSGNAVLDDLFDVTITAPTANTFIGRNPGDTAWVNVDIAAMGGAPIGAEYLTLSNDATLTNERRLEIGDGLAFTDDGANSFYGLSASINTTNLQFTAGEINVIQDNPPVTATSNYQMDLDDRVILAYASAGPLTILLPPVGPALNRIYYIKRINQGPNAVTIDA